MNDVLANWQPRGVDLSVPSSARMYDYYLGGKDNFAVDREAAEVVLAASPQVREAARQNRDFLERAVRTVAEAGVDQFIDVGTGIPTSPSVHEVVREVSPEARVVYVDNDPVVLAHNRALLETDDHLATVDGDLRDPEGILTNPGLRALINFERPVCALFLAVLHFLPRDVPREIVARYNGAMAPGSYLVASVGSVDGLSEEKKSGIAAGYDKASVWPEGHTRRDIEEILAGFDLLEPGLTDVSQWRAAQTPTQVSILAAVGRKP